MKYKNPEQIGKNLVKRFGTRDPFEIAQQLGIEVMFCDGFGMLKGMYRVIKRNRFIFINNELDYPMSKIVCAHELGHDQLHRSLAEGASVQEFALYDMTTVPEYEANMVAAEILLDENEVLDYIFNYGYSAEQIAQAMGTDVNLVAMKIKIMNKGGRNFNDSLGYRSDFLK